MAACIQGGNTARYALLVTAYALPMTGRNDVSTQKRHMSAPRAGHDLHAAIRLGAARLLLDICESLHSTVKLMFMPDEEVFQSARSMVKTRIQAPPKVDAVMAAQVFRRAWGAEFTPPGNMYASCFGFRIVLTAAATERSPHNRIVNFNM